MKVLGKDLSEPVNEIISLYYPGENLEGGTSVRTPYGLRDKIDELLGYIQKTTGAKFSRNDFIVRAIKFYLADLLQARSKRELVEKIRSETIIP